MQATNKTPEDTIREQLSYDDNYDSQDDWDRGWFTALAFALELLQNQREHGENQDH